MPLENVNQRLVSMDPDENQSDIAKVLGMYWDPNDDMFTFKLLPNHLIPKMLERDFRPTKRMVLSVLMKVFDPLGLISHYMIRAKILLQEIWRDGTKWDDPIEERLMGAWLEFIRELLNIEKLKIPRQYAPVNPANCDIKLIVFTDASELAFAATAYFRFDENKCIHIAHVMSKTKVAPLKQLSIPKLELQAAVLGVRLALTIKKLHSFTISATFFATDSRTVQSWIVSEKLKLKQFVAPRVGEILDGSTRAEWYHVRSKLNVADYGTKWSDPTMGNVNTRWFAGPEFLSLEPHEWPLQPAVTMRFDGELAATHHPHKQAETSFKTLDEIKSKFKENWNSYVRVVARMLNFKVENDQGDRSFLCLITPKKFQRAEDLLFRKIQADAFPDGIAAFVQGKNIDKSSILQNFSPFMKDGVIRMSSRTQNAKTSYAAKNPALLPNHHELVDLMIQHCHEENFHLGEEATIASVRQRAWVINVRTAFKRVKSRCQHCKNSKAVPVMPLMGQLPHARLDFTAKPFTHVGVDCFGPYEVKIARSHVKRWGMIFTCLTFRAFHLEILLDISQEECMLAIRRCVARRGEIAHIYSDRGTNFVGANNQFTKECQKAVMNVSEKVAQQMQIRWHFQPAYSPWFGGAWERLIKSIKLCIEAVFTSHSPRDDIFRNAIIEAEIFMNNRPLTHLSIDHEDDPPLTPNTALFGGDDKWVQAPGSFTDADAFSRSSYRKTQHLTDQILKRWITEYIPTICQRSKWRNQVEPIKVGDIAILVDPTQPRNA